MKIKKAKLFLQIDESRHNGLRCTKRDVIRLYAAFAIRTCGSKLGVKTNLSEKAFIAQLVKLTLGTKYVDYYFACLWVRSQVNGKKSKKFQS